MSRGIYGLLRRRGLDADTGNCINFTSVDGVSAYPKINGTKLNTAIAAETTTAIATQATAEELAKVNVARATLAALDTAGGVLGWQNPESVAIIVTRVDVDVTTKSTSASTVDIGPAANGTTLNDTCMDGVDFGTAAGLFDNVTHKGTNGTGVAFKLAAAGGATDYITISKASGACAGLAGVAYIHYIKLSA